MYRKTKIMAFLITLMIFIVCSKDKGTYEEKTTIDQTTQIDKYSQTDDQSNEFTAQIDKFKKLTQLTAKEWNPDIAAYFYNYFSQTKQHGIELSEIKIKLAQEDHNFKNIIQIFSEFTDVHLDAKDGPHPIEIYIPKDHLSLLEKKSPIFVFYDATKDEKDHEYSIGFLVDGSSIEVSNSDKPKDQPAIVFRFKEKIIDRFNANSDEKESHELISLSLKKTSGNYNEKFFLSGISFKNIGAVGEHWTAFPPEYYTKTWPCLDPNSCSQTWSSQRHDVKPAEDWNPPLEFEDDFEDWKWYNTYDWNYIMFDHTGGSLYFPRLKVEVWEEDWWAPDDFVDRLMERTDPYGGWHEYLFDDPVYGYCKIKVKRYIW